MIQGVKEKPTDERFAELCQNAGGNVSAIGRAIGVTRGTVHVWIAETPFFAQCIEDAREAALDLAEDRAMMLIAGIGVHNDKGQTIAWVERPDTSLIKFVLATKGKKRGYGESLAITDPNGNPIKFGVILDFPENGRLETPPDSPDPTRPTNE